MPETLAVLTLAVVAILAFANGANDVSKGVAALAGSGRTSYRTAIAWGSVWTLAGGLASLVIAVGFVKAFTSAIVSPDVLALATFPLAVSAGAAAWVVMASLTGLPVSTTHALTGAIVGVALVAGDAASVRWWILLTSIAAPLALSPLASAAIGYGAHAFAARLSPACVCVQAEGNDGVNADALPVSTTHVVTGAIVGAGIRQGFGAVHWGRVGGLASAWMVTLPAAAGLAALTAWTLGSM